MWVIPQRSMRCIRAVVIVVNLRCYWLPLPGRRASRTRVVFGMAYSSRFTGRKNVFSPHAWVQVWDQGRWVSYDAALNKFDATHIALASSDGNPQEVIEGFNQLSDIKIEKAASITVEQ